MKQTMTQMPADIHLLMERIRMVDLSSADALTLRSIGGLLLMLLYSHSDAPSLLSSVHEIALARFKESSTIESRSVWLSVLLHISGYDRDVLFCDVLDDDEFELLESLQEDVERWWQENPSCRPDAERASRLTAWQLLERQWQSRLEELLHVSQPLLSGLSEADLISCGCKSLYSAVALKQGQDFMGSRS